MMNLYSLSKVRYAFFAAAIAIGGAIVFQLLEGDWRGWVSAGLSVLASGALYFAHRYFERVISKVRICADVVGEAAKGHLDARVVKLREDGLLLELGGNINRVLDLTEAFTKEANTAMEYANKRRYFRKIVPTGLRGSFVYYATTINKSLQTMADSDRDFKEFVTTKVVSLANTVSSAAARLATSSHTISSLSAETGRQSITAANGAHQASTNVQAVAAAVEEFTVSTAEIAQQVNRVADISRDTVDTLSKSDETVARLTEATAKIGGVLELINKIAAQTKLLALNATIEAARAGESGKGFAVVASEVKALAEQTAHATEEISGQVGHMKGISQDTVTAMQNTGRAVREISEAASTVAAAAEEQRAASGEIARNLTEAVMATESVSESVSKVDSATQETADGIKLVSAASGELTQDAASLLKQVDVFMSKLGVVA